MDGIHAIDVRISEIHTRIASLATRPASSAGTTASGLAASASSTGYYPPGTSFADVLGGMTGTNSLASAAAELNADGVPRALAGYGNGKIPESALAAITGSTERMWAPAAEQLNKMISAAKAQGVTIGVTDGYRSYESQVRVAAEKGLYSQGGLAAQPGTSEHGWGLAADLKLDATAQAWMRQHGSEYGFVENVPREPWHWEFVPKG